MTLSFFLLKIMKNLIWLILFLVSNNVLAEKLTVYYKATTPYLVDKNKMLSGTGINIVNRYGLGTGTSLIFKKVDSIYELINNTVNNENSIGLGAVSINNERLKQVNFTLPYRITNTVLAYPSTVTYKSIKSSLSVVAKGFIPFLLAWLIFTFALAIAGMKFWDAAWFNLVTGSTVGYGDITPKGKSQKIITGIWILVSSVFLSIFTASLAVSLFSNNDYDPTTVGSIYGTEGSRICQIKQYDCKIYGTIPELLKAFRDNQIDSMISDKEIIDNFNLGLSYKVLNNSIHGIITNKSFDTSKLNQYIQF